jgi:hypothetical protein
MAENTTLNPGTGGDDVRTHERAGVKTQIVALDLNPAGSETLMAGSLPVTGTFWPATQPVSIAGTVTVSGALTDTQLRATAVPVSGPLTDAELRATAVPVSGTFFQATQPISGTVGVSGSVAVTGTFWQATQPVSGTVTANAGTGTFAISAATLPLPSGASTSAKQPALGTAGTASSDVLTVQGIASMTALKVDGSAVTQPVSGTVAVTGTFWQATQPVSGTVTANAGTGTFAISAAALPLPSGAATSAKQPALGTAGSASSDVLTVQGVASMTALKVDGSAVTQPVSGTVTANAGSGTFAISAASLPLPSGAATSAKQDSLLAAFPSSLGTKTSANSLAVVLASDQASVPITATAASSSSRLLSAAATTNATSVKGSSGTIKAIQGYNAKTSPVFLKIYNKASSPTVGSDTPVKTIYLPASSAFAFNFSFTLGTGIAYALTGAAADADTTALSAGDILCLNIDYI